tara:strand:+ start:1142 stop:1681 length:540 start_codon:yes stop_codon:yes gene_type:complete
MTEGTQSRVEFDEHGKRTTYDEIEVGRDLGSLEWVITEEDIEKQCSIDEDFHPWFSFDLEEQEGTEVGPWDGVIAPPQIQYRPPRWLLSRTYNIRGVFYKWDYENLKPIRPGETITVTGRILDKWIDREREFMSYEAEGRDEEGDIVFRTTRVHALDVLKRDTPRAGAGEDSGFKQEKI